MPCLSPLPYLLVRVARLIAKAGSFDKMSKQAPTRQLAVNSAVLRSPLVGQPGCHPMRWAEKIERGPQGAPSLRVLSGQLAWCDKSHHVKLTPGASSAYVRSCWQCATGRAPGGASGRLEPSLVPVLPTRPCFIVSGSLLRSVMGHGVVDGVQRGPGR
jgi:hypothetical protein